ncbi:Uncharacterised protein [Sebaldella termitidis]|uniref:Uncharacterized protein n=1 Tax=Sebaldella termitidis (strain ATCC 33386 / NCTC 11300) TaxID=526218 RepID=D1AGM8_SEBTE|nr:hypothetical protein [Sebaldella termitidis]ACZ10748.1 hypothetical protein Sterm_3915 [Sebaldella termitidis ATCC 33386]SUI26091.1 Uncharacterised protein [Sebaldella termitidis]
MGFKEEAEYIEVKLTNGRTAYLEVIEGELTGVALEWIKVSVEF